MFTFQTFQVPFPLGGLASPTEGACARLWSDRESEREREGERERESEREIKRERERERARERKERERERERALLGNNAHNRTRDACPEQLGSAPNYDDF